MDPDICIEDDAWLALVDLQEITRRAVAEALAEVGNEGAEVAVNFADDETLSQLNGQWRGKAKPTNVLSFPTPKHANSREPFLGDIILAAGTTRKEAEEQGKKWIDHIAHLVVHGVLHLAGHDHENEEEAAIMEAAEIRVMSRLGLANPYESS